MLGLKHMSSLSDIHLRVKGMDLNISNKSGGGGGYVKLIIV